MKAYWFSFFLFDVLKAYLSCFLTWLLVIFFELEYDKFELVLISFPWAIVPFSYCCSYIYTKESTAQTFTIYQNILLGSIGSIVVFALRMVEGTALWGDRVMWIMRFTSPIFDLCNAIIYSAERSFMYKQRDENRMDIDWRYPGRDDLLPNPIEHEDALHLSSLGGDVLANLILAVIWTCAFIYAESRPDGEFERLFTS